MKSDLPKVLHKVAGRSMLGHVLTSLTLSGINDIALVVGPNRDDVVAEARLFAPHVQSFVQHERKGTAHATLAAEAAIARGYDEVLVVFADTPLILPATFNALRQSISAGGGVAVLGFEAHDPSGYGRLIMAADELMAIREHKDASPAERAVTLCNAGLMAFDGRALLHWLKRIGQANAQGEFYLTDCVEIARQSGAHAHVVRAPESEVLGVNDRVQLAQAEHVCQQRLREHHMRQGVTLIDPASVFFAMDSVLGRDVLIEPHVFIGAEVVIGDRVTIHASSHIEGARIGDGSSIGPFARLRPGSLLDGEAKVGNFVELKAAHIELGAKISHLSYIGDAHIGAEANIGAGTITCNYDGYGKYKTEIGAHAFIGSNSSLVAPVSIGEGAFVGSGSVITHSVAPDALALARGQQVEKQGWAKTFRAKMQAVREARRAASHKAT
jgi:bifunctional UDP-N-acetylglucosamine pyrophosphorylase / glucosamine-1-phosphate N-acetyltransferase